MAPPQSAMEWEGQTMLDPAGEKIGKIEEIFLVEETGRPEWALVKVGRLKSHTTLVPLTSAQPVEDGIKVGFAKDVVEDAPPIEAGEEPDEKEVVAVYDHYRIPLPEDGSSSSDASAEMTQQQPAHEPQQQQQSNGSLSNGHAREDLRDQPVSEIVKQVSDEAKTLVGQEVKLAKAEMGGKVKDVGIGAGMFGGAGFVAGLAALGLMLTAIFALDTAMQTWLAALIVTVVLAATAGMLALLGKKRIQNAGPPVPEQTIESVKETVQTVKEEAKWGLGQTSR